MRPEERAILRAMDIAFRAERNSEYSDYVERMKEKAEQARNGKKYRNG